MIVFATLFVLVFWILFSRTLWVQLRSKSVKWFPAFSGAFGLGLIWAAVPAFPVVAALRFKAGKSEMTPNDRFLLNSARAYVVGFVLLLLGYFVFGLK